ncbi:TnsA-like heteromeric transposase endonuclease subunit [Streptomyces olivoreticuli]|uniref:TnsA-like heteromeric transposase endonuclease subunit n=1 Tax=Streptomyces olivoreticuli TaxID=68246 RepID=UPI002657ACC8|nr:TnsA-like heteromeric transposase endonuclease subunit [Streptomyces olivoreticuli]WKK21915.1 TnsA-like heteromeric transposase endonuclease subunit [Streptomyces olivoreticuli]
MRPEAHQVLLHYLDADGAERRAGVAAAAEEAFEHARPARAIPSYPGQRNAPGRYWAATTGRVVHYESFLELQNFKLLDYDQEVAGFAAQPFLIEARDGLGAWVHTPDVFVRRRDGTALVVDVKPRALTMRPDVALQFWRTAEVCARAGWDYRVACEIDPLQWATLSWLSGYRRPLHAQADLAGALLDHAHQPVTIGELTSRLPCPERARPVVFHLMWHHHLAFDASRPLRDHTRVWATGLERNA